MPRKAAKKKSEPLTIHVRWMIRNDMPAVLDIESRSFDSPWYQADFIHCLKQRNCIGMVAELLSGRPEDKPKPTDKVIGHMIYNLHKTFLELLNFAVHPDFRRRGVGRTMIEKLVSKLSEHRRMRVIVDVADFNLAGQLFFKACGFKAEAILEDRFEDCEGSVNAYHFVFRYREEADSGRRDQFIASNKNSPK